MNESKTHFVYIHLPFCKSICSYCDFCKFFYNENWVNDYLDNLEKEIKDRYMDDQIETIYIGGGTPSCLTTKQLKRLFIITKIFNVSDNLEFTFECNLNDLNESLIKILSDNNVNRVSIGIESFNQDNLLFLKRKATYEDAKEKINLLKKYHINNINVDLMYALPNETIKTLKKDLKLFCKLPITHISTYSLMIEKNTEIYNQKIEPIDEYLDAKMYKLICRYLKRKGFNHYEISNFAKDNYISHHNLAYWNNYNYYGFGVGASGYLENIRYDNTKSLTDYQNGKYVQNEEILSKKEIMDYEVILGFRKLKGINVKEFYDKYHQNIQNVYPIEELLENNDLIYKKGYLYINPKKLYLMNEVLMKLV